MDRGESLRFCFMLSILFLVSAVQSQWISVTNNSLHRTIEYGAGAIYGDSIYFMGSQSTKYQMQEYQISSNTIIDHGTSPLPHIVYVWAKYYAQIQDNLYIFSDGAQLMVYHLASSTFPNNVSIIPIDDTIVSESGAGRCMAASDNALFMVGGWFTDFNLVIFNLWLNLWSVGPSMNMSRLNSGCIATADDLYVIGGNKRASIEKISMSNIHFQQWQLLEDELTEAVCRSGIALYKEFIWVVGGRSGAADWGSEWIMSDYVWNIDTTDDSVTLLNERLPYAATPGLGVTLIVDDVLYVFGPYIMNPTQVASVDWMYYHIKTESPTQSPSFSSAAPTESTFAPTFSSAAPTQFTFAPTFASAAPSSFPSQFPSIHPSVSLNEEEVKDNVNTTIGENDDELSDRKKPASNSYFYIRLKVDAATVVIVASVVIVFAFVYCCYLFHKKRKRINIKANADQQNMIKETEQNEVKPAHSDSIIELQKVNSVSAAAGEKVSDSDSEMYDNKHNIVEDTTSGGNN